MDKTRPFPGEQLGITAKSATKLVLLLALLILPSKAAVDVVKPEDVGFSSERLQKISQMIQRHIDARDIAGAVTLVARKGRVAQFQV